MKILAAVWLVFWANARLRLRTTQERANAVAIALAVVHVLAVLYLAGWLG